MDAAIEHDWVKEGLLIEGLQDWISLSNVHSSFLPETGPPRPLHEVQQLTSSMIRELVGEGLFVLGSAVGTYRHPRFAPGICRSMPPWPRLKTPASRTSMTDGPGSSCVG